MKSAAFLTLGCKVNYYETEKMKEQFLSLGYTVKEFSDVADVYVINTCTVTNVADRKSRKMLHRARRLNENALVVAAGCYVDSAKKENLQDELVDIWVSNKEKEQLAEIVDCRLRKILQEKNLPLCGEDTSRNEAKSHTRAYVKVQEGCNQFCSYCIIPYVRGRIHSRPEPDILEEIRSLAAKGTKEVVITGIHLSSYGVDTAGEKDFTKLKGMPLLHLIEKVAETEGIERIRFGSIEPRVVTEEFAGGLLAVKKVCPHFHLSLQSGCDSTLKRMNRHYTTSEYKEHVELLRKYFGNPAVTTDVIVGFPQESEEEFAETKRFLQDIAFSGMHIFKYSRRQGTAADRMEGQVDEGVKNTRSEELLGLEQSLREDYRRQFTGKREEVLFEESVKIGEEVYDVGYTKHYVRVALLRCGTAEELRGRIKNVEICEPLNTEYMKAML